MTISGNPPSFQYYDEPRSMTPEAIKRVMAALKSLEKIGNFVWNENQPNDRPVVGTVTVGMCRAVGEALALLAAEQAKAPPDREVEEAIIGWRVAKTSGDTVRITIVGEALIALLRRPSPVTAGEWQDISTAPKDGTEIDVWIAATGLFPCRVPNCHWHCGVWLVWGHDPEIGWLNVETKTGCEVTHWMPLPLPPSPKEAGR